MGSILDRSALAHEAAFVEKVRSGLARKGCALRDARIADGVLGLSGGPNYGHTYHWCGRVQNDTFAVNARGVVVLVHDVIAILRGSRRRASQVQP